MSAPTRQERILGGLWGSVVGDALGVPVEFKHREAVQSDPVTGMRGFGTHRQPAGTWSDDSSLLLCSTESLVTQDGFDSRDTADRFLRWGREGYWTPHGKVFDIGNTTEESLVRLARGWAPEEAGGDADYSNGNGSIMRILPVSIWYSRGPTAELLNTTHRASALTHRHPRTQMACGFLGLVVRELLNGARPNDAYQHALSAFQESYTMEPFCAERMRFQQLEDGHLAALPEDEIDSGGYVIATLTASLWCLLNSDSFGSAVLKAVNLGDDTDTTGCVTGGLAGLVYGFNAIPAEWRQGLARNQELGPLFDSFATRTAIIANPQSVESALPRE